MFPVASTGGHDAQLPVTVPAPAYNIDHTRRTRLQKTRPNEQRDAMVQHIVEQLSLADLSRPAAIAAAQTDRRASVPAPIVTAVVPTSQPAVGCDRLEFEGDDLDDESALLVPLLSAQVDVVPLLAGRPECAHATIHAVSASAGRIEPVGPGTLLGPRDLSECPVYTRATDDLSCLSALPSNIFAQALVNGFKVAAVVDTGARVTLLHGAVFDEMPASVRPSLVPSQLQYVSATGTSDFAVRGVGRMTVTIAGVSGEVLVTICDQLHVQCLIGDDFLLRYGVSPCRDDLCVRSAHGTTPYHVFYRVDHGSAIRFVAAHHDHRPVFIVPARHRMERWVPAPAVLREGDSVYVEPAEAAIRLGVFAARAVCTVTRAQLRLQLLNVNSHDVPIFAHDEVAVLTSDFSVVSTTDLSVPASGIGPMTSPGDLSAVAPVPAPVHAGSLLRTSGGTFLVAPAASVAGDLLSASGGTSFVAPADVPAGDQLASLADRGPVLADRDSHGVDRGPVVADRGPVMADRDSHGVDRGPVLADRDSHGVDRGPVVADCGPVMADRDSHGVDRGQRWPTVALSWPSMARLWPRLHMHRGPSWPVTVPKATRFLLHWCRATPLLSHPIPGSSGASVAPPADQTSASLPEGDPNGLAPVSPVDRLMAMLPMDDSIFAHSEDLRAAFQQFLVDHMSSFALHDDDYGCTTLLQHHIVTDPNAAPVYQRPRPVPLRIRKAVETEVNKLLAAGIVVPSSSEWSSPIVVVKKKDGGIRLCVDYRALNDVTVKDSFPLPRIDDLLNALHGATLYTTIDLQKGFHQIRMGPESRCKTAFAVPWGLYEYQVMPFGVCNGPSSFQRLVTMALGDLLFTDCLAYIDDIMVYAADPYEMLAKLQRVFTRLTAAGLKVKPQKCHFGMSSVDFLGHHVSADGTRPLQAKLTTIAAQAQPATITELRAFLGLTNYYRDYIANYSELAAPLYDLLRKATPWQWLPRHELALSNVKTAFVNTPVLGHPSDSDIFVLDTDASDEGIGGVLAQIQNGTERVISCGSRLLTPAERNYDVTRRELLAVVFFCRHFRYFLYGAPFALRTDHNALRWLLSPAAPATGQNARWLAILADFPMVVFHRGGHLHGNADALSRAPLLFADGCLTDWPTMPEEQEQVMVAPVLARYKPAPEEASLDDLLDQSKDDLLTSVISAVRLAVWPQPSALAMECPEFRAYHARRKLLVLQSDQLYLQYMHHGQVPALLLVVPRVARCSVISECHDSTTSAHFAERKTLHAVRQRFWWPQVREDVQLYCRRCLTCQMCSRRAVPPGHAPMATFHAGTPYEVLGVDFIGPMPPTSRRYRYILTMVDHFTRLTILAPTRQQTAEATVTALIDYWVVYYGVPRIIHSDRGTNFTSQLMTTLCERLGARRTRTTAYRPQADGRVERANRTIKECLTRLLRESPDDWDLLLPQVSMALNSTVHDSTGFTPFYLAHGSEMQLPLDLAASITHPAPRPVPDFVDDLLRRFSTAYTLARTTMLKQATRSKRLYDASARTIFYATGDKVFYAKKVPDAADHVKFFAPWAGPCTVTEVLSDLNVRIRHDTEHWERVVHVDSLCKQALAPESSASESDSDDGPPPTTRVSRLRLARLHRLCLWPLHRNLGLRAVRRCPCCLIWGSPAHGLARRTVARNRSRTCLFHLCRLPRYSCLYAGPHALDTHPPVLAPTRSRAASRFTLRLCCIYYLGQRGPRHDSLPQLTYLFRLII